MSHATSAREYNFDGLVGPTHNYGGLSLGNLASMTNLGRVSNPKAAALQGLAKMRRLMDMGLPQAILPPHERPYLPTLRRLGFTGRDADMLAAAWRTSPTLVANISSASAMWTANAATVSPSADTRDRRVHLTPANLSAMFHRSLEAETTGRILHAIFADPDHFAVHDPVPGGAALGDEGAANHGRLCTDHGVQGLELFVYGQSGFEKESGTAHFRPRQSREASEAVIRTHGLTPAHALLIQQSAKAIDAGAFHNDVVAVANGPALLFHEEAFEDREATVEAIRRAAEALEIDPVCLMVASDDVSLEDAIGSYLFNSQLITKPDGHMMLVLPLEARENPRTEAAVQKLVDGDSPIDDALFLDLRQSMRNGGGPACLRLRVVLEETQVEALGANVILNNELAGTLETWINRHYRDRLAPDDLRDPTLIDEGRTALDDLSQILDLGAIYDFQR